MDRWKATRKAVCFGLIMFSSSAMNNLFVTYYLDLYVNVMNLEATPFYIGQIIFMVWNALNDPIFGWLSDMFETSKDPIERRLDVIRRAGWAWALAFALVFIPLFPEHSDPWIAGFQFTFALCLYDGFLTLVEVNHSALLADISTSSSERARLNAYSAVGAGIGSLSSVLGHAFWTRSLNDLIGFQRMTIAVALFCGTVIHGACLGMKTETHVASSKDKDEANWSPHGKSLSVLDFLSQLRTNKNFILFQAFYLIQTFDCTFEKNHFGMFLDVLSGDACSPPVLGMIISLSFILPWVGTIFLTPSVQRFGIASVVRLILLARIAWCTLSFLFGRMIWSSWFSAFFLLSNRVMSESVCRICPLIITDLVDEDKYRNKRRRNVSASVVGLSTFLGKGSQSLAPMFGFYVLQLGQNNIIQENPSNLLTLVVAVPIACVVAQNFLWQSYTLNGAYLKLVKEFASGHHAEP